MYMLAENPPTVFRRGALSEPWAVVRRRNDFLRPLGDPRGVPDVKFPDQKKDKAAAAEALAAYDLLNATLAGCDALNGSACYDAIGAHMDVDQYLRVARARPPAIAPSSAALRHLPVAPLLLRRRSNVTTTTTLHPAAGADELPGGRRLDRRALLLRLQRRAVHRERCSVRCFFSIRSPL